MSDTIKKAANRVMDELPKADELYELIDILANRAADLAENERDEKRREYGHS